VSSPALKEWSAAVHALLDGRQTVLLRKGGIAEKRFAVAAPEFLLFPTVAHSHRERVRPEHRDLLELAAADSTDTAVTIRAAAKVVAAIEVNQPDAIDEIDDLHIWTAASVRTDRLDFRPKHRLTVLVVQARPLTAPVELIRVPAFGGCKSWVELNVDDTVLRTREAHDGNTSAIHDDATLQRVAERVRASVG
jgi:hypothetical protein